ncbi:unnamed protein product [Rotaria sp. Silwood1]|nr:unnamed protein product [Rotaria sp. Silwood1]
MDERLLSEMHAMQPELVAIRHDIHAHPELAMQEVLGKENVDGYIKPLTAGEDFAYFLEEKPGAYMGIGNGIGGGSAHAPTFIFNDECIPFGVGYWISLVQQELKP